MEWRCYNRADYPINFAASCWCTRMQTVLTFNVGPSLTFRSPCLSGQMWRKGSAQFPGVFKNVMKRFTRVLAMLLIVAALPAMASSDKAAKALFQKGKDAEVRQDYIAAYNFYHQAYNLKPSELRYRAAAEYVRFLASASYVHQGELLVSAGKLQEALTDFEQALAIDPSSFIAQQQANKVQGMIKKAQTPNAPGPQ